jgi:YoeB-like toxin of bacterial type II toxin-antitoxin system
VPPVRCHVKISVTRGGWEDYITWSNDRTILKRINRMIEEAARDPAPGIGTPNPYPIACPASGLGVSPTNTASTASSAITN